MANEFLPEMPGLDAKITRKMITCTIRQLTSAGEHRIQLWSRPAFRYTLTLNFSRGYKGNSYVAGDIAKLSEFFWSKRGDVGTFLITDPVSGEARRQKFATTSGTLTSYQVKDSDGIESKHIQGSVSVFAGGSQSTASELSSDLYLVNPLSGIFELDGPMSPGINLYWSGSCAKEVRFDSSLDIDRIMHQLYRSSAEIELYTPKGT
jgi:hypothetical protein